jgi:WD40 repeat protein
MCEWLMQGFARGVRCLRLTVRRRGWLDRLQLQVFRVGRSRPGRLRLLGIRQTAQLSGFESLVSTVRFSPDSKTIAAGSDDKTARLWDVKDPTAPIELAHLTGPSGAIQSLTFNWAGTHLAGGIGSHEIWV